jgi:glycosyltransferase involved in cell wall biosynthesis
MNILFIDWAPFDYDATTPLTTPLGGTQSATVYLSSALAERGHRVAVINKIAEPIESNGVLFTNLPQTTVWLNGFDVIISVSGLNAEVLNSVGCVRPVVAWCQHDTNQNAVTSLRDPSTHSQYAGFAMVSAWQQTEYIDSFNIASECTHVLPNAISKPFETIERNWRWLEQSRPPVLTYISTPFRGLDVLLLAFPMIRQAIPDVRLRIHGGMGLYHRGNKEADAPFSALYELARSLPGVENIGPIGQTELSESMSRADILAYPCTFRETSCISVMESLAAGLLVMTTSLGALPETTSGYSRMTEPPDPTERANIAMFATRYAHTTIDWYKDAMTDPVGTRNKLESQAKFFKASNTWANRAADWEVWLGGLI